MAQEIWSPEDWAWEQIREGKIADFNAHFGQELDPRDSQGWGDDRKLSARFLRKIFCEKPYCDELPPEGVSVIGAFLPDGQMLQSLRLSRQVWLRKCRSESLIDLTRATISGELSFEGSFLGKTADSRSAKLAAAHIEGALYLQNIAVEGVIDGDGLHVGRSLFMDRATFKGDVILNGAKIDGHLAMRYSIFKQKLHGDGLQVGQSLMHQGATFEGDVILNGAKIGGQLDMGGSIFKQKLHGDGLQVGQSLYMQQGAIFHGEVILRYAKIDDQLGMMGSTFKQRLNSYGLHVGGPGGLVMDGATFEGEVILSYAKIDGFLAMGDATFKGKVILMVAKVGRQLGMTGSTFKGEVILSGAKIDGPLVMARAIFKRTVNCNGLHVGQHLVMSDKATFEGEVILSGAKIGSQLDMEGSTFKRTVNCNGLHVGQHLLMSDKATFEGEVILSSAEIGGQLAMILSTFEQKVEGENLQVGGSLLIRDADFKKSISLPFSRIGGSLDLRGAQMAGLDLSGGSVTHDLTLAGEELKVTWLGPADDKPRLILRNTQVRVLQDNPDAWPAIIELEGFTFSKLGGLGAVGMDDARNRPVEKWKEWLERDRQYTPQPYTHLASVFAAAGRRDQAHAILFAGRERERKTARQQHRMGQWLWLTVLACVCGYGIGSYTFRVLWWIGGSVVLGTLVLWFGAPAAHDKGLFWCIGASLDRLLPIIQLNKEFADFFHDPGRAHVAGWVIAVFAGLGLLGWVLGSFLIAALSGLTQKT